MVGMRKMSNVFEKNKRKEHHYVSDNNVFVKFLLEGGLYDSIDITKENIFDLIDLTSGLVKINAYCPECGDIRTFEGSTIFYYDEDDNTEVYIRRNLEEELELLQKMDYYREVDAGDGIKDRRWDWKNWQVSDATRLMVFSFKCTLESEHKLDYVVITSDYSMKKIGQYPSFADLSFPEIKQYRKVMTKDDEKELRRAIGLYASGIGIGSFVYLRRIFERMIEDAKVKAVQDNKLNVDEYNSSHVGEKIKLIADYLPKTIVEVTQFYGIISKGIHELSEEECKAYFPVLKEFVFLILIQREELRQREEKENSIKITLNKISSSIK